MRKKKIITSKVVVTINARPSRFRIKILDPIPDMIRSSSHEWEER